MSNEKSLLDLAREIEGSKENAPGNTTSNTPIPNVDLVSITENTGVGLRTHLSELDKTEK